MSHTVFDIFRLIKISHTLFALPFALASFLLAARNVEFFPWENLIWVLVAMFGMRSAAMCFNRYLDADIDAQNPRTVGREIPQGVVSRSLVLSYTVVFSGVFFLAAWMINDLAFKLSPIAWVVCLGYSFCKRFTSLSHFVLGVALGLSPIGAWIAVTESFNWIPVLMGGVVLFWTAGFDILYACLDSDFDKKRGLHSVPASLGIPRALFVARLLHVIMILIWALMVWFGEFRWPLWTALILVSLIVVAEHTLVKPDDLKKMNLVFFKLNVVISFTILIGCSVEVWL